MRTAFDDYLDEQMLDPEFAAAYNSARVAMGFPCTGCGLCCRFAGEAVTHVVGFTEPINPDGSCSRLTADNKCSIYATRPEACRIPRDKYRENALACNELITLVGLDKKYLVKVPPPEQ